MNARPVRVYRSRDGQVLVGYDTGDRDEVGTEWESARLENVRRYSDETGECMAYYPALEGSRDFLDIQEWVYVRDEMTRRDESYSYWADQWTRDEYAECHAEVRAAEDAYDVARRAFNEIAYVVGE